MEGGKEPNMTTEVRLVPLSKHSFPESILIIIIQTEHYNSVLGNNSFISRNT
jgi:hypothetical protein